MAARKEDTTEAAVIARLRAMSVDGVAPARDAVPASLSSAAERRFGSYTAAVLAAGLQSRRPTGRPPHPGGVPAPGECRDAALTLAQALRIAARNGISSGERVLQIARALREMRVSA